MDAVLQQRWKSVGPPFDGECLHLVEFVQLRDLQSLMIVTAGILRQTHGASQLFRIDDWHEHDGYITERSQVDWDDFGEMLSEESFYAARHGDTDVRWAHYPGDYSFLLRFYIADADEDPTHPGIWGDFDLCGSSNLIATVQAAAPETVASKLVITNAKDYFDRYYGG